MNAIFKEINAILELIKEIETMKLLIVAVLVISLVYLFRKVIAKILAKKYTETDLQSYREFTPKNKSEKSDNVIKEWKATDELIGGRPDDR